MAAVTVVMSGDEAALFRAQQRILDQQLKLASGYKGTSKEAQEAAKKAKEEADARNKAEREHLKMMERGKAMTESLRSPREAYNAKMKEANELHRRGAITTETLQRKHRQLKSELIASTEVQGRFNRAVGGVAGGVENITQMAVAYVGVQAAVTAVTGSLQQQIELQKESLALVVQTGKAQQDAIKNFTGLTPEQKQEALRSAIEIQQQTGFAGRDQLVQALGAGFSASGDIDATVDAVSAAAELSRLTPDQVAGVSSGALDIRRGSGVQDAESNLGFLLQAGSFARIEDPTLLAKNLAPAVASASGIFTGDQQQVAKESAALFAAFSRAATDKTGESTSTATITFNQKLAEFFNDLPAKAEQASQAIAKLEADALITEREQLAIGEAELRVRDAEAKVASLGTPRTEEQQVQAQRARLNLQDAQLSLDEARASATLSQEERDRLELLKKQQAELSTITAPGTPLEAARILQENAGLREEFTSQDFGEARFKDAFKAVFDPNSAVSREATATAGQLQFSRATFDEAVSQLDGLTPEIALAQQEARGRAQSEMAMTDPNRAAVGLINQIAADTLPQVRSGGISGGIQAVVEAANEMVVPSIYNDPESIAQFRIGQFEARKSALEAGGVTASEAPLVRLLEQQIALVNEVVAKLGEAGDKLGQAGDKLQPSGGRPNMREIVPQRPDVTDAARLQAGLANQGG